MSKRLGDINIGGLNLPSRYELDPEDINIDDILQELEDEEENQKEIGSETNNLEGKSDLSIQNLQNIIQSDADTYLKGENEQGSGSNLEAEPSVLPPSIQGLKKRKLPKLAELPVPKKIQPRVGSKLGRTNRVATGVHFKFQTFDIEDPSFSFANGKTFEKHLEEVETKWKLLGLPILDTQIVNGAMCTGKAISAQALGVRTTASSTDRFRTVSIKIPINLKRCVITFHEKKGLITSLGCSNEYDMMHSIEKTVVALNMLANFREEDKIQYQKPLVVSLECSCNIGAEIDAYLLQTMSQKNDFKNGTEEWKKRQGEIDAHAKAVRDIENTIGFTEITNKKDPVTARAEYGDPRGFTLKASDGSFPGTSLVDKLNGNYIMIFPSGSIVISTMRGRTSEKYQNDATGGVVTFNAARIKISMYSSLFRLLPTLYRNFTSNKFFA